ncbi:metallophosphoesterase family protein [Paenibacillus glycinis]|uniref:Calcineurin-like phosphoesterase domain-containing protein n=1 Tax=Paenibacillus glycinis TaxID=2697035 RepID=A0ABW9XSR7_9BACL|nr:metallophosphoesterase [Paenibacillus glycinis]NBD25717.1 hypothetical protein [Paenibacillus glycinis]
MSGSGKLTIHWTTDLHIRDQVTGLPGHPEAVFAERHYYGSLDKWRQAVDIANREMPDLFVCTGDIVDGKQSLASFLPLWERVRSPKAIMIGNHDLDNGYDLLADQLRGPAAPVVAGSRFNRSFALTAGHGVSARVLLLDTYVGEDGEHRAGSCLGTIEREAFAWLEQEMSGCPEPVIFVFAHNGIGGPEAYFDQEHVRQFVRLAENVGTGGPESGPAKDVYYFAGHHHVHPAAEIRRMTPNLTFVNGVAMVAERQSYVNAITLEADGAVRLRYLEVGYPYPESPIERSVLP